MKRFGLIGYPLGHSFSRQYFSEKFKNEKLEDHVYENFELKSIDEFPGLINSHPDLQGLNVTIPYKEQVIPFLDELDETAARVGAVNVIHIRNGKTQGYNSDLYGFRESLLPVLSEIPSKALVLGTGGASKAVRVALTELGIQPVLVSRNPGSEQISYEDLKGQLHLYGLIVNTTPLGTFPKVDNAPAIPYEEIVNAHCLFDLVYNPELSLFLQKGWEMGATVKNGLEMLELQADRSWEIWHS